MGALSCSEDIEPAAIAGAFGGSLGLVIATLPEILYIKYPQLRADNDSFWRIDLTGDQSLLAYVRHLVRSFTIFPAVFSLPLGYAILGKSIINCSSSTSGFIAAGILGVGVCFFKLREALSAASRTTPRTAFGAGNAAGLKKYH